MQNVQPYEYTIYLAPEEDIESPVIDESILEQIKSIHPIQTSSPSQTVSCQSDISNGVHSVHKCSQNPHTNFPHPKLCTPCVHLPVTPPISTHNQVSSVVPNCNPLHSCSPLPLPQSKPFTSTSKTNSSSICHCPAVQTHSPVSAVSMPLKTVQTVNASNLVQCDTSTIPPLSPTATTGSIVTATTPAPLVTTTSPSNHTLSALCQNNSKTGPCTVVIKKAIILLNGNENPANVSSIAKAFGELNDNDNDSDFEDLQENDDVTILDGRDLMYKETGIDSPSKKSPSIGSKIIDLLEKVHHELQISNQRNTESFHDDDYSNDEEVGSFSVENDCIDEIELNTKDINSVHDKNERIPNEQKNVKKCETGEDLVEACKNLSKTIASYQRPVQKQQ